MKVLQEKLVSKLIDLLQKDFPLERGDVQFSIPPDRKFGDLSSTIPFVIARKTKKNPVKVGEDILKTIRNAFDFFQDVRLAGGGFINFYFKNNFLLSYLIENAERSPHRKNRKVIVEHTSINPNKSAHIGHLRNACLGDTLARGLSYLGYDVEVQNYIDDTGVQVADVVWGVLRYRRLDKEKLEKQGNLAAYLWDLYADVHRLVQENSDIKLQIREVLQRIESKQNPEFEMSRYISGAVLLNHIQLMESIGIRYHLLVRESDIIELEFFPLASRILKTSNVMYRSDDPQKKGCWVIRYDRESIEKIIVRSDHTITYIGKDIAYALWKMGRLEKNFFYRKFYQYTDSEELYMTAAGGNDGHPDFGNGYRAYNVIGRRQSYLQNIISQVLDSLDGEKMGDRFIHFSYEMVALTPRCVQELGFDVSDKDRTKPFVDVSGRKGIAVKADELIDKLIDKSLEEVRQRNPDLDDTRAERIARDIAVGSLRYFMVKFNSNSVIAFDFKDALNFEGDSGPYLQYTLVRLKSILRKLGDRFEEPQPDRLDMARLGEKESSEFHEILLHISQMDSQIEFAIENRELSVVTTHAYALCQKFNHYYHIYPVISEKSSDIRTLRLSLILLIKKKLERLLGIIGIPVPERM